MNCPKCCKEMTLGEIANTRADYAFFWAPKTFFDRHWANPYCHFRKTIEAAGGVMLKANSKLRQVPDSYGCTDCKLIIVDYS